MSTAIDHPFEKCLRDRFPDNPLMAGSGNPWWPDHALGSGSARWASATAKALTDNVVAAVGVSANYRAHEAIWFGG